MIMENEHQKKSLKKIEIVLLIMQLIFILVTIGFFIRLTMGELTIGNTTFIRLQIHHIFLPITCLLAVFAYTWYKGLEHEAIFYYLTIGAIIIPISLGIFLIFIGIEIYKSIKYEYKLIKIDWRNERREHKESEIKKSSILQRLKKMLPFYDTILFGFSVLYLMILALAYPLKFGEINSENITSAIISLILVEIFFIGSMVFYFKQKIIFRVFSISLIIMGLIIQVWIVIAVIIIVLAEMFAYFWLFTSFNMYHDEKEQSRSTNYSLERPKTSF